MGVPRFTRRGFLAAADGTSRTNGLLFIDHDAGHVDPAGQGELWLTGCESESLQGQSQGARQRCSCPGRART